MEPLISSLPAGPFGAILADPPWHFSTWGERPWWHNGETVDLSKTRAADKYYGTMRMEHILALPVASVAAPDCTLFLWCCCPQIPEALRVIEAWGFKYKTVAFTWAKVNKNGSPFFGLGYWTRANAELCLLATQGHPKRVAKDVPQLVLEGRREHSRKPDCVRERIQRLVAGPYLELFARSPAPGWVTWGNETEKFEHVPDLIITQAGLE